MLMIGSEKDRKSCPKNRGGMRSRVESSPVGLYIVNNEYALKKKSGSRPYDVTVYAADRSRRVLEEGVLLDHLFLATRSRSPLGHFCTPIGQVAPSGVCI
jgi:hypothetical protein